MLDKIEPNPAGMTCYDKYEMKALSNYKSHCDGVELDLRTFETQYNKCLLAMGCEDNISTTLFWSSVATSLILGFIAGAAR